MIKQNKLKLFTALSLFFGINFLYAKVNTVVSILPQETFVKAIGGDKVNVALMVKPGNEPHSYEPKPSQMKDIAKADIYFSIGVEFEDVWIPKFENQNKKMKIVNVSKGIRKVAMLGHHHHDGDEHEEHGHDEHEHGEDGKDPHIWLSPLNVQLIAKNIYTALATNDPANKNYYKANYKKFVEHVQATDKKIRNILFDTPTGTKFMVFHPAWGYFARDYGLTQLAIEVEGKNPKPKQVIYLIKEAKEEGVKAVFTAPEFSDKIAKQIASEVSVPVVKMSPLKPKWSENLITFAKAIANK
jgi:zinc transport system substrate-binding protein